MANNVTKRVLVIDTAGSDPVKTGLFNVRRIFWAGADIALGDRLRVTDVDGVVLIDRISAVADDGCDVVVNCPANGIIVTHLSHGTAYIQLDI